MHIFETLPCFRIDLRILQVDAKIMKRNKMSWNTTKSGGREIGEENAAPSTLSEKLIFIVLWQLLRWTVV